jgi:glycosyltransferase involved in cell wall biosynthesis
MPEHDRTGESCSDAARERHQLMLVYWGRRGPFGGMTADLAAALAAGGHAAPSVSLSAYLEDLDRFSGVPYPVDTVQTFASERGALTRLCRLPTIRRQLEAAIRRQGTGVAVTVMAHVWSPFVTDVWRRNGVFHAVIVHDADPHPGDRTALVQRWLLNHAMGADAVVTLSEHVARQIERSGRVAPDRIIRLFLPDLSSGPVERVRPEQGPLRFLFFGRIAHYKGLPLFAAAVKALRARGLAFEASVIGDGDLGESGALLEAAGVRIDNRWIAESEVPSILAAHDIMVSCHTEASQSGVVSLAMGAGMPSIVTPVGGLAGQLYDGVSGVVAAAATGEAVADAMERLIRDRGLALRLFDGVEARRDGRSFAVFERELRAGLARLMPARPTA